MNIRQTFAMSAWCLARGFALMGKAVWMTLKRLFTAYPNQTWAVITAAAILIATVKIGEARAERDRYAKQAAQLQLRLGI